jgi:hypothetical protein
VRGVLVPGQVLGKEALSIKHHAIAVGMLAALGAATASLAGPKPQNNLEQILYEMGVIGYCGLSSDAVKKGFNRELGQIIDQDNIDRLGLRDAQNRVLTMVEWEWDNRGLGGFRGWCRTEGESAVKRFLIPEPDPD